MYCNICRVPKVGFMCASTGKKGYQSWALSVADVGFSRQQSGQLVPLEWVFRVFDVGEIGTFRGLCTCCGGVLSATIGFIAILGQ